MSLFGTTAPKFTNSTGTVTVLLDYSLVEPNWADPREIEQESIITAERNYVTIGTGDHSGFKITVHLWKYGDLTAQKNKFKEIYAYNHQDIIFFPNRDGASLRDSTGTAVLFHITDIGMYWQAKPDMFDTLVITIKSKKPVDLDNQL